MADKDFVVKNGLVVNANVLVVNGTNVGVNTAVPDAAITVAGTANLQGNVSFTGNEVVSVANVTFFGNVHSKNSVYIDQTLYVGNTATMVQDLPTIMQAVDNFNGFVMISSQNLSQEDDACADVLIYADITNGLSNFNDLGINNTRFDGRIHRITVNASAGSWQLGETVFQRNAAGANIAVGQIRDITTGNLPNSYLLKIRVSEDDGLPTYVGMPDFANTAGSNLSLRAVTSGSNADILAAVPFGVSNPNSRRNYAFTISKRGDGYLYNANSALAIGTTSGGIRAVTESATASFSSGANVITVASTSNIKPDHLVFGTGIATDTYVTSVVNTTAFRLSKPTTAPVTGGTLTFRDEFYDLDDVNNPIIFHTGGMMAKNEIARFTGNGNFVVGLNTSRAAKLNVGGNANVAGQLNVGSNVFSSGNVTASGNVYSVAGVFSASVNVGVVGINSSAMNIGNTVQNSTMFTVTGNTTVSTSTMRSSNLTIGNNTVTDSGLIQVQNSAASANVGPGTFRAGNSTVNTTAISVGANALINTSAVFVGNSTVNVTMAQDATMALRVGGNASITTLTVANNLLLTNSVVGQANFAGNVAVAGNVVVSGNIYVPFSVVASAVNVGIVTVATTQASVGANVLLDSTGLKITGNTLIPSMNVSGGNITLGNNSISNTPTISLTNSTATSNLTPGGFQAGIVSVNGSGVINVGTNASLTTSTLSIGNTTTNLVFNSAGGQWPLNVQANAYVNGDVRIVANLYVQGTVVSTGTTVASGDFVPSVNSTYDIGGTTRQWKQVYANGLIVNSAVSIGNSTVNAVAAGDYVRVASASSFVNLSSSDVTVGNTTVNSYLSQTAVRVGNSTLNSALTQASLVMGNSSVNATVNSTGFFGNTFGSTSNVTTANATTVNATTVNTATVNSTTAIFGTVNASSGNVATMNSSTMNAVSITANVFSITVNSTSMNATSANIATVNATTINSTTVNAATFQIGTAFVATASQVTTANLTILGNLQVTGVTTFVNTANLDVKDINITLGKGASNPAAADGGGITLEGANVSFNYSSTSGNWVSNTGIVITVGTNTVTTNSTGFWGNVTGILTGNVSSQIILSSNVTTTNLYVTTVNASANVLIGANVLINASAMAITNSTASYVQTAGAMTLGNSVVTTSPQIVVQNTAGVTTISSNLITTNTVVANLIGNVTATNISGSLTGNVSANIVTITGTGAGAYISHGSNVVANSTGRYADFLGGVAAANYVKIGGGTGGQVGLGDGGTNTNITATQGGIAYGTATGINLTPVGTLGQILVSNSTNVPVWTSPSLLTVGNSANLGGVAASSYQLNSTLSANVATMTALNALNLNGTPAASYVTNADSRTLSGNLYFIGANNVFEDRVTFVKSTSQSNTTAAAWFSGGGGAIALDTNMCKRISWNDGGGNFNLRAGHFHNGTSLTYQSDGTGTGGASVISLNSDGASTNGAITLSVAVNGADGTAVTFPTYMTLVPDQLTIAANTTLSGNVQFNGAANGSTYSLSGTNFANTTGVYATFLSGVAGSQYYRAGGADVALADGGTNSTITSAIAGGIVYSNATGMDISSAGTSGQLLTSSGTGAPTWTSPSSLTVGSATTATTATTATNATQLGGVAASSYLQTSVASSTYLPLAGGTITGAISGGSALGSLVIGQNGGVNRGQLYNDSNGIGFLTNGGAWAARVNQGTNTWAVIGDIIAFASDARLKKNVREISDPLNKLTQIRGVQYNHTEFAIEQGLPDEDQVGVIAQEIEKVLPEVVTLAPFDHDGVDENGNKISKSGENYKTVKYDKIVALLIEAVKELSGQVNSLKDEIAELKK